MVDEDSTEEIFVFPMSINHDAMAEALVGIKNKTSGDWRRIRRTPVSAGFIANGICYGESVSLRLNSRPQDTALLRN